MRFAAACRPSAEWSRYCWLMVIAGATLWNVDAVRSQTPDSPEGGDQAGQTTVDFQQDVRPILADTCYKCHGPDAADREAGLRLDTRDGLFESGAVQAGDLANSMLHERVTSTDPGMLMPPPDSGRELDAAQIETLRRWIEQGAAWQQHWSLVPPRSPELPAVQNSDRVSSPIDRFVLAGLESRELTFSPPADRRTLIRRVTLDLTGLPPSPELLQEFVDSQEPDWYETLVDRLLAQPAYGEHMGRFWLDAARYGDTHGLHLDNYREMWAYRDWVIEAFNRNLSYRDFTIEQLAGDLLPEPTADQRIASGFNRAHVTTNEGGSITEEVYVRNVVDRVATTGTVFMGLTVGCAQCHDHKFDPISQREFYQLFAFFNNLTDPPMDKNIKDPPPVMKVMDDAARARQAELTAAHAAAIQALDQAVADWEYVDPADHREDAASDAIEDAGPFELVWVQGDRYPQGAKVSNRAPTVPASELPLRDGAVSRKQTGEGTIQHFFTEATIPVTAQSGDMLFADVYLDPDNPPEEVMLQFNDGSWEHRVFWGADQVNFGTTGTPGRHRAGDLPETGKWVRLEVPAEQVGFKTSRPINGFAFTQFGGTAYWNAAGIVSTQRQTASFDSLADWIAFVSEKPDVAPGPLKGIFQKPRNQWSEDQFQLVRRHFLLNVHAATSEALAATIRKRDEAKLALDEFNQSIPTTLVSQERDEIKPAFVLNRGEYDQRGDEVQRLTPAALPPFPDELPKNRLGLARWLTTDDHPLTARVAVNRFWQQLFGTGIVKTSEDFGAQGSPPTHPRLLDYLATDFVSHGWDVKRLMKQMVMSTTYRQRSVATPALIRQDPGNRWLARGPRFRLDAEVLRDQALAISGLLNRDMGGPSVKPPQPDGLWFAVGYSGSNTVRFKADQGADKIFRRSVYTFWKRTAPPPQMNTFDAPSREECSVRRERTNTPLQALLLMNEPQYVQAARQLAQLAIDQQLESDPVTLQFMFTRALARPADERELSALQSSLQGHQDEFSSAADRARKLVAMGDTPADLDRYDAVELAAWTMVANLIMNLDEFVTKN